MEKKKIFFIYMPSPTLGRSALQGINGGLFSYGREELYIAALQRVLNDSFPDWAVERDNTESNIEKLMQQDARLLICAPGLRFQFNHNGFDKKKVIHLSTMEYMNNNVTPVLNKIDTLNSD